MALEVISIIPTRALASLNTLIAIDHANHLTSFYMITNDQKLKNL